MKLIKFPTIEKSDGSWKDDVFFNPENITTIEKSPEDENQTIINCNDSYGYLIDMPQQEVLKKLGYKGPI